MGDKWFKGSAGWREQADLVTAAATGSATDWDWLKGDEFEIEFGDELEEAAERMTAAAGASPKPDVGGRHGSTFTLKGPVLGQLASYDGTSDTPVASPLFQLLLDCLGTKVVTTYDAADVGAACTTTTLVTTAGTYPIGCLTPYGATGGSAVRGQGWATTQATQDVTLAGVAAAAGVSGDDVFPTVNGYTSFASPTPKTVRYVGQTSNWDLRLIGSVPTGFKLYPGPRKRIMAEVQMLCTDWTYDTGGGLQAGLAYKKLPAVVGANGGRLLLDGAVYCPTGNWEISCNVDYAELDCPSALQGVQTMLAEDRQLEIAFDIPLDSDDITSNELDWDSDYEAGTDIELDFQLGNTTGLLFGWYAGAAFIAKRPQPIRIGKKTVGRRVVARAGVLSSESQGDGAVGCINSSFRMAIG